MPQVEVQWPTEDEEFDTANSVQTAQLTPQFAMAGAVVAPEVEEADADTNVNFDEAGEGGGDSAPETSAPEPAAPAPAPVSDSGSGSGGSVSQPAQVKSGSAGGRSTLEIALAVLVVLLLIAVAVLYSSNSKLKSDKSALKDQVAQANANPQAIIQKQTNDLLSKVGKLMQLPTGETPTVAQVTDVSAAKKQSAFFNNAQNGDKVLLYVKAGEAILYRPSTNKIILVAPLTFTSNSSTTGVKH